MTTKNIPSTIKKTRKTSNIIQIKPNLINATSRTLSSSMDVFMSTPKKRISQKNNSMQSEFGTASKSTKIKVASASTSAAKTTSYAAKTANTTLKICSPKAKSQHRKHAAMYSTQGLTAASTALHVIAPSTTPSFKIITKDSLHKTQQNQTATMKRWLSKKELEHFEAKLLEMRHNLHTEIAALETLLQEDTEYDEESMIVDNQITDDLLAEQTLSFKELQEVNLALEKIKNHTYGYCEITKEKISKKRLEALPTARTNISDDDE